MKFLKTCANFILARNIFFSENSQRLKQRLIGIRNQDGVRRARQVYMLVPMPPGDNEHIALGPVKALILDHRVTRAAKHMIDGRIVMPMLARVQAGGRLLAQTSETE